MEGTGFDRLEFIRLFLHVIATIPRLPNLAFLQQPKGENMIGKVIEKLKEKLSRVFGHGREEKNEDETQQDNKVMNDG